MGFCDKTIKIWLIVGKVMRILRIVIPLIIIVLGSIDLAKAVVSSDDKAISKSAKSLLIRLAIGVAIFFVPTIINVIFSTIEVFTDEENNDYTVCFNCISNPSNCKESKETTLEEDS